MKRVFLTMAFAAGLSALMAACGGGGSGSSTATTPVQCNASQPSYVMTTCGCTIVSGSCTAVAYGTNGYGANGFNGFNNGGFNNGGFNGYPQQQYGYNSQFGNPGYTAVPQSYYQGSSVPACAYTGTCYYAPQASYYPQQQAGFFFYIR